MSDGKCGAHYYGNIDQAKIDAILAQLKEHGATVSGDNPWDVDTHQHGLKLRMTWDKATSTLTVIFTDMSWYVPCSKIWDFIDPLFHHIQALSAEEISETADVLSLADEDGKCGVHRYGNIDQTKVDAILKALKDNGATVTGSNPWDVDTHNHGVKLRGTWDKATSTLSVIVTDKSWYVPCGKIWDTVDPLIHHIQALSAEEISETADVLSLADEDGKCGVHRYGNIDQTKVDAILKALKDNGATVTGSNPWDVDTHNHGVKLRGTWDKATSTLSVIVTDKSWYVPCGKIWDTVDPLIHHIQGVSAEEMA